MQVPCFMEFVSLTRHSLNLEDKHESLPVYMQPPVHETHCSLEVRVFHQMRVHV